MKCFVCGTKITPLTAAKAYSLESGMCQKCYAEYLVWCEKNEIPQEDIECQN